MRGERAGQSTLPLKKRHLQVNHGDDRHPLQVSVKSVQTEKMLKEYY